MTSFFFHDIGVLSLTYKFLRVFSYPLNIERTTYVESGSTLPFDFRNKLHVNPVVFKNICQNFCFQAVYINDVYSLWDISKPGKETFTEQGNLH